MYEPKLDNINPFPNDNFRLREFADDLNFMKMEGSCPKRVENTVGKGEIAHHEQFLLFPVFSKDFYCRHVKTRACLGKSKLMPLINEVKLEQYIAVLIPRMNTLPIAQLLNHIPNTTGNV